MDFFSRADERDELLARLGSEQSTVVTVIGEHGSGKTSLFEELARVLETPSAVVRINPRESSWPLSGMSALLSAVDRVYGTDLMASLRAHQDQDSEFVIARSLHEEIHRELTTEVVILIDDADHMDELSQTVLGYLLRRMGPRTTKVVLGVTTMAVGSPLEGFTELRLGPLSCTTLSELGRSVSPPTLNPESLDFAVRVSAGSALALRSILEALPPAERDGEVPLSVPLHPGQRLQDALMDTIDGLSAGALYVLRVVAASSSLPVAAMECLPSATPAAVQELLAAERIHRAGDSYQVSEPPLQLGIYWSMPPHVRHEIHRHLAEVCTELDPGLSAWHRSYIEASPHSAVALLGAARELIDAGEFLQGIRFAERALSLRSGEDLESPLEELVTSLLMATEIDTARRYLRFILAGAADGATSATTGVLRVAIDVLQTQTVNDDVIRGVLEAHAADDPAGCALLLSVSTASRLGRGEIDRAQAEVELALEFGRGAEPSIIALSQIVQLHADAAAGKELPSMRDLQVLVESAHGLARIAPARLLIARALLTAERYDDARRLLDIFEDYAEGVAPLWSEMSFDARYVLEFQTGRFDRMAEIVALLSVGPPDRGVFPLSRELRLAESAGLDGDRERARKALDRCRRRMQAGVGASMRARIALVTARLAIGEQDLEAAARSFAQVEALSREHGGPHLLRFHDEHLELLLRLDRRKDAVRVRDDLRRRSRTAPSRWAQLALARCEALLLNGQPSLDAFRELLSSWPDAQEPLLHAETLRSFAERLRLSGHEQESSAVSQEGLSLLRASGASRAMLQARGEGQLDPVTVPRPKDVLESLSAEERQVVELVARGHKNQMIAHELYLSVRTVELRLTTIYRKTAVSSRYELLRLLDEGPPAGGQNSPGSAAQGGGAQKLLSAVPAEPRTLPLRSLRTGAAPSARIIA